ncbi:hypothetical protein ISN44_As09g010970 [Arabidopsis suecica]|uniref:Uncharacterized protein n=1 Tax=Arabidopsis suecica TaxID=45249 RepID=A0A8T2AGW9_ARASU|nr:hypothetical protein ISN44_As09g010970 [Arabidopsis suecica]
MEPKDTSLQPLFPSLFVRLYIHNEGEQDDDDGSDGDDDDEEEEDEDEDVQVMQSLGGLNVQDDEDEDEEGDEDGNGGSWEKYLVRPVGRAEDEEDASDFEPKENGVEEEIDG